MRLVPLIAWSKATTWETIVDTMDSSRWSCTRRRARSGLALLAMLISLGLVTGCDSSKKDGGGGKPTITSSSANSTSSSSAAPTSADPNAAIIAAAEEKLKCSWATTDAAVQNPAKDWYVEIRKCAGDPYLSESISTLKYYVEHGVHVEGTLKRQIVSSKVVLEQPASVEITFCVDQSDSVTINAQGEKLPDPSTLRRLNTVRVVDYGGVDGFLVQQKVLPPEGAPKEQPC